MTRRRPSSTISRIPKARIAPLLLLGLLVGFSLPFPTCARDTSRRSNAAERSRRPRLSSALRSTKVTAAARSSTAATVRKDKTHDEKPKNWFYIIPQPLRFCLGGTLGNVALYYSEQWAARVLDIVLAATSHHQGVSTTGTSGNNSNGKNLDAGSSGVINQKLSSLLTVMDRHRDSVSFFGGYLLHIPLQHMLYAVLVYGLETINTPRRYLYTLAGTYSALGVSLVGSTVLNAVLRSPRVGLEKNLAFAATLVLFAAWNYVAIGWVVEHTPGSIKSAGFDGQKQSSARSAGSTSGRARSGQRKWRRK